MELRPPVLGVGVEAIGPPGKAQRRSILKRKKMYRGMKRGLPFIYLLKYMFQFRESLAQF